MEPDRLASALACLDRDALARMSRSLAWNARRSRQQGRPERAVWQETLRDLLDDELATRDGRACCRVSPTDLLRRACLELPERDRFVLHSQYTTRLHDVECHAMGPSACLFSALADELRRPVSGARVTTPDPVTSSNPRRP
jgi:hypothetical protein